MTDKNKTKIQKKWEILWEENRPTLDKQIEVQGLKYGIDALLKKFLNKFTKEDWYIKLSLQERQQSMLLIEKTIKEQYPNLYPVVKW